MNISVTFSPRLNRRIVQLHLSPDSILHKLNKGMEDSNVHYIQSVSEALDIVLFKDKWINDWSNDNSISIQTNQNQSTYIGEAAIVCLLPQLDSLNMESQKSPFLKFLFSEMEEYQEYMDSMMIIRDAVKRYLSIESDINWKISKDDIYFISRGNHVICEEMVVSYLTEQTKKIKQLRKLKKINRKQHQVQQFNESTKLSEIDSSLTNQSVSELRLRLRRSQSQSRSQNKRSNDNKQSSSNYTKQKQEFRQVVDICDQTNTYKAFGKQFEHVLMNILDNQYGKSCLITPNKLKTKISKSNQQITDTNYLSLFNDKQEPFNVITKYFNRYFKSLKNSECVIPFRHSKTDIYYINRDQSLNEISVKTKYMSSLHKKLTIYLGSIGCQNATLNYLQQMFLFDPVKMFDKFINKDYEHDFIGNNWNKQKIDGKTGTTKPYKNKKKDNVKFWVFYFYNQDNPNKNYSGFLSFISVKRVFKWLKERHNEKRLSCEINHSDSVMNIFIDNQKLATIDIREEINGERYYQLSIDYHIEDQLSPFVKSDFLMALHLSHDEVKNIVSERCTDSEAEFKDELNCNGTIQ